MPNARCPRSAARHSVRGMRALRRTHPGWFELGVFALAYLTYFGVRALTEGNVSTAVANALDLVHVERRLDLDWEDAIQGLVLGSRTLLAAVNAMYIWGHWPLLIVGGFLLFRLGPGGVPPPAHRDPHLGRARADRLRPLPGGAAAAGSGRPARHRDPALGDLPEGAAAVVHQRVRRHAELPRGLEPAAGDRALPRQPASAPAGVRGPHAGRDGLLRGRHRQSLRARRRGRRRRRHRRAADRRAPRTPRTWRL